MSESRWSRWVDHSPKKLGFSAFIKEAKTGVNPTGTGIETPAQRAQRMGLQSDGHGSYMDPNTGQIVARTINNELVFYDNGPTGGAVSDGEGGDYKPETGATGPTYTDPDTGMVMVPPAKPKSKEELAAVPDHTPATAPAGFKDAMRKKKEKGQRKNDLAARLTAAAIRTNLLLRKILWVPLKVVVMQLMLTLLAVWTPLQRTKRPTGMIHQTAPLTPLSPPLWGV